MKKHFHAKNATGTLQAATEVLVTEVITKDVPIIKEWVATTDGYINAKIRAHISGYLTKKAYDEGSFVKEGQLMFEIDPRQYEASLNEAKGNLVKAEAAQRKSQEDVNRYAPLVADGAVSKKELDDASRQNDMNKAAVSSARAALEQAKLNLDWTKVCSPISGVSGAAIAQVGDLVNPESQLTTVSDIDPIRIIFPITENEYIWYQKVSSDNPTDVMPDVSIVLNDGSVYPEKGHFTFADRQIDSKTGTINVYVTVANPKGSLRPGQYAKVRAQVSMLKNALVIPKRAIIETQGTTQVAVVSSDNKVDIRNVTVGYSSENIRVITSGLKEGELVVVEGFLKIQPGMTVDPKKDTTNS
ncbi:MAG: efflux RND transporter periplasmic adaptor subunit [Proteobacteria bacterium]|nr:efflux RND transporter periplasmic adaptor subunit [Pseudomonadota bacterium]